jgi:hypothetical protein
LRIAREKRILVTGMEVIKVIAELRSYKAELDEAITVFDRLAHRRGEKRGRPLGSSLSAGKRKVSAETRKRMAMAQRKRWAGAKKKK